MEHFTSFFGLFYSLKVVVLLILKSKAQREIRYLYRSQNFRNPVLIWVWIYPLGVTHGWKIFWSGVTPWAVGPKTSFWGPKPRYLEISSKCYFSLIFGVKMTIFGILSSFLIHFLKICWFLKNWKILLSKPVSPMRNLQNGKKYTGPNSILIIFFLPERYWYRLYPYG